MKKIIFLFSSIVLCVFSVSAQFETAMQNANQLYEQNKFTEAYTIYKGLVDEGQHSYQLFYNLGSTYYQLDSVAPSIYYFEKAKQINGNDDDLEHNLSLAYGRQQDDIDKFPELFVVSFFKNLSGIFSSNFWLILSILTLWTAAALYYLKSSKKGFLFEKKRWLIPLFFGLFAFLMAYLNNYYNNSTQHAIVYHTLTEVHKSANTDSESIQTIHEGLKLVVLDEVDEWMKVKMTDNTVGWLKKAAVKKI